MVMVFIKVMGSWAESWKLEMRHVCACTAATTNNRVKWISQADSTCWIGLKPLLDKVSDFWNSGGSLATSSVTKLLDFLCVSGVWKGEGVGYCNHAPTALLFGGNRTGFSIKTIYPWLVNPGPTLKRKHVTNCNEQIQLWSSPYHILWISISPALEQAWR